MQPRGVYWYIIGSVTCSTNPDRRVAVRQSSGLQDDATPAGAEGRPDGLPGHPVKRKMDLPFSNLLFLFKYCTSRMNVRGWWANETRDVQNDGDLMGLEHHVVHKLSGYWPMNTESKNLWIQIHSNELYCQL